MTRTGQLEPTSARRIDVPTTSGPIAALQAGDSASRAVLLLPGFTGSKEDFTPLLDPLAGAGFRVTSVDLPGQFQSPGPENPAGYRPDALAPVVHEIVDRLGPAVHVVGHSFGGLVARAAVIDAPKRYADLVLMSSGPAAIGGPRRQRIEELAPLLPLGLPAVHAAIEAALASAPGYVAPAPELAAFLERRFVSGSPAMLAGMADALRTEPDRVDELAAAGRDLLVLFGADDDAWPAAEQRAMAERLDAAVAVIPGAAHSPAVENTAATAAALIAFWNRASLSP